MLDEAEFINFYIIIIQNVNKTSLNTLFLIIIFIKTLFRT